MVADGADIPMQPGYDSVVHAQANNSIKSDKILAIFNFDPANVIHSFIETGVPQPVELISRKKEERKAPFREQLSSSKRSVRNPFIKELIHGVGLSRVAEIHALYETEQNYEIKRRLALAAHELVDIYFISSSEYDTIFNIQDDDSINDEISERRKKYSLFE